MLGAQNPLPRAWAARLTIALLLALALVPVAFIATRVVEATRDVVYWDEYDTALSLILQLDRGVGFGDFVSRIFAVSNEHRMVTSRLMFAGSYWLTGTINFAVINAIGNAALLGMCALLVFRMETAARRVRMAVLLALILFQLEHYENFLWSGSSIDHFQVVLLAVAAVVGLARGTLPGLFAAMLCALLATLTLAHGIVTWAVGAVMLAQGRRWRHFGAWCGLGTLVIAGFLAGFHFNTAQRFVEPSLAGGLEIARFWLALIGAVPALGAPAVAPWLGAALLGLLGWLAATGAPRREPIVFPVAGFALGALALIAVGRAAEAGGLMHSRYFVLGALAWAATLFMALERAGSPRRPYALLWGAMPLLVAFNISANRAFMSSADSWVECRDRAASRFKQYGVDGRGPFTLHPIPAHSTALLEEAERRGVYRMAPVCAPRSFPDDAQPTARIAYHVDAIAANSRTAYVEGWAALPGAAAKRGTVCLVLRSPTETHLFSTVTITRPDVARVMNQPTWQLSGFRFALRRDRLPTGEFQVGLLIDEGGNPEYIMTDHRLRLVGDGKALLATGD